MAPVSPGARILHLVAPRPSLMVPPGLTRSWEQLCAAVRIHLCGFLCGRSPDADVVTGPADAPPTFVADLARGGCDLRAAFPGIVRRVEAIEGDRDRVKVRIACEATHDGSFFGFMLPTRRPVRFTEVHDLHVDGDRVVEDQLAIDFRAIIRQLGGTAA